jgi:ABC-2 type transport system permease protein
MRVLWAFIKKDISIALSYRLSFLLQFLGMFLAIATFYFLSKVIGGTLLGSLNAYGGDYFSFVLLGLALSIYMTLGLQTFSSAIREGQMTGTLEIMLLSPTKLNVILLSSAVWAYVFDSLKVFILLVLGTTVFGVSFANSNVMAAIVILMLSIACFASIGMISAALTIVLKKGDPISWAMAGLSTLLSGVFYPVAVLPHWLQSFSSVLPLTYALNAIRHAVLQGFSFYELRYDILALVGFSVALLPLALFSFKQAVKRAKIEGSLVHY